MDEQEYQDKKAKRAATRDAARAEQYAKDLAALDALEEMHGDDVERLDLDRYCPGLPTFVVVQAPDQAHYKKFVDLIARAVEKNSTQGRRDAQDSLARACFAYPSDTAEQAAVLAKFPGVLVSIAIRATAMVQAKVEAEGKD